MFEWGRNIQLLYGSIARVGAAGNGRKTIVDGRAPTSQRLSANRRGYSRGLSAGAVQVVLTAEWSS